MIVLANRYRTGVRFSDDWGEKRRLRRHSGIGAEGDRTLYLLVANQALSQMSYGPLNID